MSSDHVERLGLDDVAAPSLIASEHLHRYELAARLCDGLRVADVCCGTGYGTRILAEGGADAIGVDSSEEAVAEARAGAIGEVRFEQADALEYLERELVTAIDAIVMFEGLEHLPDLPRATAALRRLAGEGVRLAVSIPNSRVLGEEDNPFHETDFDHELADSTLRGLGDEVVILSQFMAEGSLIRGEAGTEGELSARPVLQGRAEPELASHYIGLVGFGEAANALSVRMLLNAAPVNRSYMLELEASNARLWDRLEVLQARLERIESSLPYRASAPLRALLRRRER